MNEMGYPAQSAAESLNPRAAGPPDPGRPATRLGPLDLARHRTEALIIGGFLVWTCLGLFEASLQYVHLREVQTVAFGDALLRVLPRWYLWGLLTPVVIWTAGRYPLERGVWRTLVLVHLPVGLLLTGLHVFAWLVLRYNFIFPPPPGIAFAEFAAPGFALFFAIDLMAYWAILGGYFTLHYGRRLREREVEQARLEVEASRLETRLTRARLHVLTAQLQPHSLFNTLNAISELILTRPRVAEQMVVRLGDLLRRLTELSRSQEVELRDELSLVEAYLDIESLRYGDRLRTRVQAEPELLDARVPTLCLQPLVENAIRHGLAPAGASGEVGVVASAEDGRLRIDVADTGVGIPTVWPRSEGVGLSNIRQRLEKLYGAEASLRLRARPGGGAVATLRLPLSRSSDLPEVGTHEPPEVGLPENLQSPST